MNYKFVKISSYYDSYLEYFYKNNNNIPSNYTDHLNKIFQDCFSYGNTFSKHLHKKGNKTHEIIYNDERLQKKWADENNFS